MSEPPIRVGLISLGCAKNTVDAELMLGALLREGFEITNDPTAADALIVNTCAFIDAAQEESIDAILESAAIRDARHRGQALVVSGCLPQRFREELPGLLPEVDAFIGVDQVPDIGTVVRAALTRRAAQRVGAVSKEQHSRDHITRRLAGLQDHHPTDGVPLRGTEQFGKTRQVLTPKPTNTAPLVEVHLRPSYIPDHAAPRFRLTPPHFAYLKIAEGCNHPCSFCTIPRMRGSHRSRPLADLVQEARQLLAEGVKELNLISQDSTYYGLDLRPKRTGSLAAPDKFHAATAALPADAPTLGTLLRALNALPGQFWIRILYTHPAHWTDELIHTIAECPKVVRYIDLPLQHIHDTMLARMRRETPSQHIRDLIRRLRAGLPGLTLRSTFIVGFPGETEACFQALLDFVREARFERLGVFTYSREEGTIAGRMAQQVPDAVKQRRRDRLMAEQHQVARAVSAAFVGRTIPVLVEGEVSARDLAAAHVRSWEHGFLRESDRHQDRLRGRYLVARGEADAPDIDGRVYVRGRLPIGQFARVKVIGHTDYDLIAEPA